MRAKSFSAVPMHIGIGILACALMAAPAQAQCQAGWLPGQALPGVSGYVYATAVWDDGTGPALYLAGSFSIAGDTLASGIAKWDGTSWQALGSGIETYSCAYALTVYNNELIVGGDFTSAGGLAANYIAAWNGTSWHPLDSGIHGPDYVTEIRALTVYNGQLIAAGAFTGAGGVTADCIAAWNGTSWQPLSSGMTGGVGGYRAEIYALTVYSGQLVAGGNFTAAGGVSANYVAAWNGNSWSALVGLTNGLNSVVHALAVYNRRLIAGGFFSGCVAAWDGIWWQTLGVWGVEGGYYSGPFVWSLIVYNGQLIVGGMFTTPGKSIVAWNDTTGWQTLGSGVNYIVAAMAVFKGSLIVGGEFSTAGGMRADSIAAWDGVSWHTLGGSPFNQRVYALTVYNGELIAAGSFTTAAGVRANRIAAWDGTAWHSLGTGMDTSVYALAVYDELLVAAGGFTKADGLSANHIAAWNGTSWQALGTGINNDVWCLTVYNDQLVAGGWFWTAGGIYANNIAAWDGVSWRALGTGLRATTTVVPTCALNVYNGELIAGGGFDNAGGVWTHGIAAWNGSSWHALGRGMGGYAAGVFALSVYNGSLVAGGNFTSAGGVSANDIAMWDGSSWHALDAGTNMSVGAFAVYEDALIASGGFTRAGGASANRIAAWNGVSWQALGSGMDEWVMTLAVYDGSLVAGGDFRIAGGRVSPYLARWGPTEQAVEIVQQPQAQADVCPGSTVQFTVAATGTEPLMYQWQKDGNDLVEGGHYSGVNTAVLTVSDVGAVEAGEYRCVVTNDCGPVASEPASLTLSPDTDEDGVPDCLDRCPGSDLKATIVIGDCDSGVANQLLGATGCTMADELAEAAAGARNRGAFASAVAGLTESWLPAGLITGADKGRIQHCAAESDMPTSAAKNQKSTKAADSTQVDESSLVAPMQVCGAGAPATLALGFIGLFLLRVAPRRSR